MLEKGISFFQCLEYPLSWLRDNCQSPENFHPVSKARHLLLRDVASLDLAATEVVEKEESCDLNLEWSDGHRSTYDASWLRERAFTQEAAEK